MRGRPSALVGLKPITPEPWASDEKVYKKKVNVKTFRDRYADKTARVREHENKRTDYKNRFFEKYSNDVPQHF